VLVPYLTSSRPVRGRAMSRRRALEGDPSYWTQMKKHCAIALITAVWAIVLLPQPASAQIYTSGPYTWGYRTWWGCTTSGGTYDQGWLGANAFIQVNNSTSTNHMEIGFTRWYLGEDSSWHQDLRWKAKSLKFGDKTASTYPYSHTFPFYNDPGTYVLGVQYRWYDDHWYGDRLLFSRNLNGNSCTPL
jgi:hypothetical protein